ncbi:hypothetical protein B0T16DRAFT_118492 [Cercophora newfieldiana]|uniref:Uncharacterized protein n=1 Tax=Cercophora newfieldiana TaxID=92897 RepID=A0AA40CRH3_9PEZI|nr:hypothetical protein B0T16DRAFT_118492 [Cercophora newfieldiana]
MEAVGIIPLALTTLKIVDQVVRFFGRLQNCPREIRMLRTLLAETKEDLRILNPPTDPTTEYLCGISTDLQDVINDTLTRCKKFLTKYCDDVRKSGNEDDSAKKSEVAEGDKPEGKEKETGNIVSRVVWTVAHGEELNEMKVEIERISMVIINRLYLRRILTLQEAQAGTSPQTEPPAPQDNDLVDNVVAVPPANRTRAAKQSASEVDPLRELPPLSSSQLSLKRLEAEADTPVKTKPLQEAEALQKRQSSLNLRLLDILDTGAVAGDADFPNLCGSFICLQGDQLPPECRSLRLEKLQVAARDEASLLLQFECSGGAIGIRHLVPLDAFPYISDINPPNVSFRAKHAITLMRREGDCLFHIRDMEYKFTDVPTRRRFQELIRGRTLRYEFEASEITALAAVPGWTGLRDYNLAAGEPLQVWQLDRPKTTPIITMTFLAGKPDVGGRRQFSHLELYFGDRVGEVRRVKAWWSIKGKRKAVQGQWVIPYQPSDGVKVTFQNEQGEFLRFLCPRRAIDVADRLG